MAYAKNAADSGLDGVVCSPLEAALVKEQCGESFLTVTPGIRFADSTVGRPEAHHDSGEGRQVRLRLHCGGPSITQAADPVAAYRRAVTDFFG